MAPPDIKLRWASETDYATLGEVMFDAVRNGPSRYSDAQRRAWTPEPRSGDAWNARLDEQSIIVAETAGRIVGFMSLKSEDGYLDFAYIRPSHQRTGLFRKLYDRIEALALAEQHPRIHVHASLIAEPAFSALGFSILRKETVFIGDQSFDRFEMEKRLDDQ